MEKQRVIACIDGFNFYFGLRSDARWKKYFWLDVVKFFELGLKEDQELGVVKTTMPGIMSVMGKKLCFFDSQVVSL